MIVARGEEALQQAAAEIRKLDGVEVIAVAADITSEAGRAAVLAAGPARHPRQQRRRPARRRLSVLRVRTG